jgi:trehalose/maltose hydrolase-like predicted phosphorylase
MAINADQTDKNGLKLANWTIEETDYHPSKEVLGGTFFLLGNGYMGLRGSYEETATSSVQGLFVAGVYSKKTTRGYVAADTYFRKRFVFDEELMAIPEDMYSIVNLPDPLHMKLFINAKPFRMWEGKVLEYHRRLDMKRGCLHRRVRWDNGDGLVTRIEIERFCSMDNEHLIALRYSFTPENYSGTVRIETGIDAGVGETYTESLVEQTDDGLVVESVIAEPRVRICHAIDHRVFANGARSNVTWSEMTKNRRYLKATDLAVEPGATYCVDKFMTVCTSRDPGAEDVQLESKRLAEDAARAGYGGCFARHERAWDRIWLQTDIRIDGEDEAQNLTRFALYHLVIATPRNDSRVSIGARGLSGKSYSGLVFWETDIYLQSYYGWTFPEWSRNHFAYRYAMLDAARANAAKEGKAGARYPWESALYGREETPEFYVCSRTQIHIVPDVAHAVRRYLEVTGDTAFFYDQGVEIILECARFMAQTVTYNEATRQYEILHVGGPDEYHPVTDNNAYTNFMTARLFESAVRAYNTLKISYPKRFAELSAALGLTDRNIELWSKMAADMYFPMDPVTGLIEQSDGFFQLDDEWETVGGRFGGPGAEYHTCKGIKQPDVLLLLALFPEHFGVQHLLANWDYYARFIMHGSSLSPSIHALIAARIGLVQKARELFLLSGRFTLIDYNKDASGGSHTGNYGGLWQSLVFGFAGMALIDGVVYLDPHLPHEWRGIKFPIVYSGNRFTVAVAPGQVSIQADKANPAPVAFSYAGQQVSVSAGQEKEIAAVIRDKA